MISNADELLMGVDLHTAEDLAAMKPHERELVISCRQALKAFRQAERAPDPNAEPTITFNLRLNEYERAQLERQAKRAGRSMQAQAKHVIFKRMDQADG